MAQSQPQSESSVPDRSIRVAQAAGMISAQVNCSMQTALILLEKRAELVGCSVRDVANAVVERRVRFDE